MLFHYFAFVLILWLTTDYYHVSPDMFDPPGQDPAPTRAQRYGAQPPPRGLELVQVLACAEAELGHAARITGGEGEPQPLLGAEVGEDEGEDGGHGELLVCGEHAAVLRAAPRQEDEGGVGQRRELQRRVVTRAVQHPGEVGVGVGRE